MYAILNSIENELFQLKGQHFSLENLNLFFNLSACVFLCLPM